MRESCFDSTNSPPQLPELEFHLPVPLVRWLPQRRRRRRRDVDPRPGVSRASARAAFLLLFFFFDFVDRSARHHARRKHDRDPVEIATSIRWLEGGGFVSTFIRSAQMTELFLLKQLSYTYSQASRC